MRSYSDELVREKKLQGTAMRHRGVLVGDFILAGKEDAPEFSADDEEMLELFASQAAAAIVNACVHNQEQSVRADLEALIDTNPVGVGDCDARANTGRPVSSNREANRIVEPLRAPDAPVQALPDDVICQLGDGRETALEELAVNGEVKTAGTLHPEEVVLLAPGGPYVSMLVNATPTPTHGQDGDVASVAVAMQELAPLEELDHLRTEFLNMVSHASRTPFAAMKGSTATVSGVSPALDPTELHRFLRVVNEQADHVRGLITDLLDVFRIEADTVSVSPAPTELGALVEQARIAPLNGSTARTVIGDPPGDLPRLLANGPRIVQVLSNLLAIAARCTPDSSPVRVAAARDGTHVAVSVSDEGPGIAAAQLPRLFRRYAVPGNADPGVGSREADLCLAICKGSWRSMTGASGPRAPGPAAPARSAWTTGRRPSTWLSTMCGCYASCATCSPNPATLRSHPASPKGCPGSSGPRILARTCSTWCFPSPTASSSLRPCPNWPTSRSFSSPPASETRPSRRRWRMTPPTVSQSRFSATELTARIQAALPRRAGPETFALDDFAVDYQGRQGTVVGRLVRLTATEFWLLRLLTLNAGRVSTCGSLIHQLWGKPGGGDADRVRTFIRQLQRKLGDDKARPRRILNERGVGCRVPGPEG